MTPVVMHLQRRGAWTAVRCRCARHGRLCRGQQVRRLTIVQSLCMPSTVHRCSTTLAACVQPVLGALVSDVERIAGLQSGRARRRQSLHRRRRRRPLVPRGQPMASERKVAKPRILYRPAVSSQGERATVRPTLLLAIHDHRVYLLCCAYIDRTTAGGVPRPRLWPR